MSIVPDFCLLRASQEAQSLGLRPLWSLSAWAVLVDVLATSRWLLLLLTVLLLAVYAHVDSAQRGAQRARSSLLSQAGLCAMVLGAVEVAHVPLTGSDGLIHLPTVSPLSFAQNGGGGGGLFNLLDGGGGIAGSAGYNPEADVAHGSVEHAWDEPGASSESSSEGSPRSKGGQAANEDDLHPRMLGSLLLPATFQEIVTSTAQAIGSVVEAGTPGKVGATDKPQQAEHDPFASLVGHPKDLAGLAQVSDEDVEWYRAAGGLQGVLGEEGRREMMIGTA